MSLWLMRHILDGILVANELIDSWKSAKQEGVIPKLIWKKLMTTSIRGLWIICWVDSVSEINGGARFGSAYQRHLFQFW